MADASQFRDTLFFRSANPEPVRLRGANNASAGQHNRKIILQAIRARGTVRRNEVADMTGLTAAAVFNICRGLIAEDLLISTKVTLKARGQPAHDLTLNPDAAFTLGLNVDRDHLTLVVLDFVGAVRARFHAPVAFSAPGQVRAFVDDCLDRLRHAGAIPMHRLSGIGVAIPDDLGSTTLPGQPGHYREWDGIDLATLVGGLVGGPVVRENDAASAAIGEMLFGAGVELDSFFYVFIGAGLGGGLVINRRYIRGFHGRSGEIGFLPQVNPLRSRETNLQKTLGDAVLTGTLLDDLRTHGFAEASLATLETLAEPAGDIVAKWAGRVADYLYLPLLTIMSTVDPEAILIGGDLPRPVVDILCAEISKRLSMHIGIHWPQMAVRPARVTDDPAAVGAATLAFKGIWEPDVG
jgi:predicted NBD/HSP70 family sugar kinase